MNQDNKYIYYEDTFGAVIGYIDSLQPNDTDVIFVTIIAEKNLKDTEDPWNIKQRNTNIAINLKKTKNWKYYGNYEEFCAEYIEAIL